MLPPQFQHYKESIAFDYFTPDAENLYVRISSNHELLSHVAEQVIIYIIIM